MQLKIILFHLVDFFFKISLWFKKKFFFHLLIFSCLFPKGFFSFFFSTIVYLICLRVSSLFLSPSHFRFVTLSSLSLSLFLLPAFYLSLSPFLCSTCAFLSLFFRSLVISFLFFLFPPHFLKHRLFLSFSSYPGNIYFSGSEEGSDLSLILRVAGWNKDTREQYVCVYVLGVDGRDTFLLNSEVS